VKITLEIYVSTSISSRENDKKDHKSTIMVI